MNEPQSAATGDTVEATFCFLDIAGYTALTEAHGEHAAADLVEAFTAVVQRGVAQRGRVHEMIGDAAFLVFPDPLAAVVACTAIYREVETRLHFPALRAGLHHGAALLRGGRYFGTSINLAARVAARAQGGEIVATAAVAEFLRPLPEAPVQPHSIGPAALKNLPEPIELYALILPGAAPTYVIDPVCKMQVDSARAVGRLQHDGHAYWFCSLDCVRRFAESPQRYV